MEEPVGQVIEIDSSASKAAKEAAAEDRMK